MSYKRKSLSSMQRSKRLKSLIENILVWITIILTICLISFAAGISDKHYQEEHTLRNPDGFILVEVKTKRLSIEYPFGYIANKDYRDYIDDKLSGNLKIDDPYKENIWIIIPVDEIAYLRISEKSNN